MVEYIDNDPDLGADRFESVLYRQLESGLLEDALIAKSSQDAKRFWQIRDGIGELFQILGPVSNQDVSLPIAEIGLFAIDLEQLLKAKYPEITILLWGHIGDNNMHVCAYTGLDEDKTKISHDIMHLIGEYAGAISAEHGVGVLKRDYLTLSKSATEIALMKTLKHAMDPKAILNRGRVFD